MKIIGNTVGTNLPKPNLLQDDPSKGDYVKGKSIIPTKNSQLENDSGYLTAHQDISGKLDADKLPEAINTALAQAKASGEFNGPKGDTGETGPKGDQGIQGEQGPKGDKGDKGADGTGVTILGSFDTEDALKSAHPTGSVGESYLVKGYLYVWSATENAWKNVGNIQGPKGETGATGKDGISVTHSWNGTTLTISSASGTTSVNLKGAQGETGATGATGATGVGIVSITISEV